MKSFIKVIKFTAFTLLLTLAFIVFYKQAIEVVPCEPGEHVFSKKWNVITPATTTSEGEESNVCDICKEEVKCVIPIHVHIFTERWTVTTPATSTSAGEKSNICIGCCETIKVPVPYCAEHTLTGTWTVDKAPTMNAVGKESNDCDVCKATVTRDIPKLEVEELIVTKAPATATYFTGETFNAYGLEISAVLSNGKTTVIKNYEIINKNTPLTVDNTSVTVKFLDFTVDVPITVLKFAIGSVSKALESVNGTHLFVRGICVGVSTADNGTKQVLLKDLSAKSYILLCGANYEYEVGDKIEVYTTVTSDSYGKYLHYALKNGNGEGSVISKGNATSYGDPTKTVVGEEAVNALATGGLSRYDTVSFGDRFYIVKDGEDYIIHFNPAATDKNGTKLDSGKYLNFSTTNIDASIITDRLPAAELSAYPGVLVSGMISGIYLDSNSESFHFEILNKNWAFLDVYVEGQEYLREIAYAFYYQLPYVDYDQYNTRRNINPTPEDATEEQRIYLDCSSYVNAVYYNAFGVNILPYAITEKGASTANFTAYAKDNPDNVDVVGYYERKDYTTDEAQKALLKELLDNLQVGDVIVYRKASSGHALIYVGGGKILHCMNTNSFRRHPELSEKESKPYLDPLESYDYVSTSSVGFESTFNLFESPGAQRYLFSENYVNFSILRPLNRGLTATDEAEARMTIPSLSIEKLVSIGMYSAVFAGDELTYTVTLKNNGESDLLNVNLAEKVPAGTEFVSASENVIHNGGNITWTGAVKANSEVVLSFKVKVTATTPGTLIESNEGKVNGLSLNKITNTVSGISRDKLDELSEAGYSAAESSTEYADPILMINAIYRELFGADILNYATTEAALNDIIDVANKKYNASCDANDMVIANLSGGYLIRGTNPSNNDRIRAVRIEYLTTGDVIIAQHVNKSQVTVYTAYIYLGGRDFLCVTSESGVATVVECKTGDVKKIQNILTSLYSYDKYAIIRPSMANTAD